MYILVHLAVMALSIAGIIALAHFGIQLAGSERASGNVDGFSIKEWLLTILWIVLFFALLCAFGWAVGPTRQY